MNSSLHATTNGGDGESATKSVLNVGGSGKGCISPFTITDMCLSPLQSHHVSSKPRRKILNTNSATAPEGGLPRGQTKEPLPLPQRWERARIRGGTGHLLRGHDGPGHNKKQVGYPGGQAVPG
jgi:hypothetical protein